ncbi:energy transducer TonB family protein [Almyronema epifaneia]|uniref:Energy transducer TonB n=1 Tax=Almyronema epifaneia S1 TaxID=2991925 RepID=A0ABW6II07_9CYAN
MFSRLSALKSVKYGKLLAPLRQPTGIAAAVSVGIHGILFAASPHFTSFSLASLAEPEALSDERTVPLVELSPAEQQRLPDFSNPTFSLLPQPGSLGELQLPNSRSPGSTAYFSNGQSAPPNPFYYNPPLGNTSVRGNPSGYSGGGTAGRRSNSQATTRSGQTQIRPGATAPAPGNQASRGSASEGVNEITPAELERRTVGVDSLQIATRPSQSADDLRTDRNGSTRSLSSSEASADPADQAEADQDEANPLRAELEAFQAAYTYSESGTSEAAAETALADWLSNTQAELEISELPLQPATEIPIAYPLRICLPTPPTAARVGILTNPAGEAASAPVLLKSTGYPGLNQKALQVVEEVDFAAAEAYQAHQFLIPVRYNEANCTDPQALSQGISTEAAEE